VCRSGVDALVGSGLAAVHDAVVRPGHVVLVALATVLVVAAVLALRALGSVDATDDASQVLRDAGLLLIQFLRVLASREVEGLAEHRKLLGREASGPAVVVQVHLNLSFRKRGLSWPHGVDVKLSWLHGGEYLIPGAAWQGEIGIGLLNLRRVSRLSIEQ
jgi:hypothetical protein